jgi:hypothetical protein
VTSNHPTRAALAISPVIARALVIAVFTVIPLRIIAAGYFPVDDAQRHAAKAISGKAWNEILVQRDDITVDQHPGWHAFLRSVHRATGADAYALTLFSVVVLFVAAMAPPSLLLRRPEAWLVALFTLAVIDPVALQRYFLGRPFLIYMATYLVLLLRWRDLQTVRLPRKLLACLLVLFALSASAHMSWYLFLLPLTSLLLAGESRVALRITTCWLLGTALGAAFTPSPIRYLWQSVNHSWLVFGAIENDLLTTELRGYYESPLVAVALALVLLWRSHRGSLDRSSLRDPVFLLAVFGWLGSFVSLRIWLDWGAPAFLVWLARDFEAAFERAIAPASRDRLVTLASASLAAFLAISSNVADRWGPPFRGTPGLRLPLSASRPSDAPWLPEAGGILYAVDMRIFFRTFFANPHATWRYALGYEPAIMRDEDLAVYVALRKNPNDLTPLSRWVRKMTAADRLLLLSPAAQQPPIPELEWQQVRPGLWSGRRPRGQ